MYLYYTCIHIVYIYILCYILLIPIINIYIYTCYIFIRIYLYIHILDLTKAPELFVTSPAGAESHLWPSFRLTSKANTDDLD